MTEWILRAAGQHRFQRRQRAEFLFLRCSGCSALSVVKDGDFACPMCGGELPPGWNIDPASDPAQSEA